jgi:hypothetical protein
MPADEDLVGRERQGVHRSIIDPGPGERRVPAHAANATSTGASEAGSGGGGTPQRLPLDLTHISERLISPLSVAVRVNQYAKF